MDKSNIEKFGEIENHYKKELNAREHELQTNTGPKYDKYDKESLEREYDKYDKEFLEREIIHNKGALEALSKVSSLIN